MGTSYLYRPARPAWQSLAGAADTLLENTLEGLDGKLLAYMVKKSRLTPDDLAQLRAILDEHTSADDENGEAAAMNLVEVLNAWGVAWSGFMIRDVHRYGRASGLDRGRVAAVAAAGVGPAGAWPVLPGPAEADRSGPGRVVVVAALGVGPASGRARRGMGDCPAADLARSSDRGTGLRLAPADDGRPGGEPCRRPSAPQPIVLAAPAAPQWSRRRANLSVGRRARPARRRPRSRCRHGS